MCNDCMICGVGGAGEELVLVLLYALLTNLNNHISMSHAATSSV